MNRYLLLPIVLVAALVQCAGAQGGPSVTIRPTAVDKATWVANAMYVINTKHDYEKTALLGFVNQAYSQGNPAPSDCLKMMNTASQEYADDIKGPAIGLAQTDLDALDSMYKILGTIPGASTVATVASEANDWAARGLRASLEPESRVLGQNQLFTSYMDGRDYLKQQLENAYDLAHENPNAAQVVNTYFSPYLNAHTADTASTIFDRNPDFTNSDGIQQVKGLLAPNGRIASSIDELKLLAQEQFASIGSMLTNDRAMLKRINDSQQDLVAYVADQRRAAALASEAELQRQAHQLKLEAANSSVYLLSKFIGVGNPKLGHAIGVTGTAAIQVTDAISKYTETASKLGDLGKSFGSVVLTGNLVGAVMNIMSLFGSAPSTEQVILDEVRELRSDVASLRTEMRARFDRIDENLNRIYDGMNQRFDAIDVQLGILRGNVEEIRVALFGVEANLNRLERGLTSFLDAGFRRDLKESINSALGFKQTYHRNMRRSEFERYENRFFSWATDFARDEAAAGSGVGARSYTDDKVIDELSSSPLDANLNYLHDFLAARMPNVPNFATDRLANPRDWSVAAEAYVRLMAEWPKHAKHIAIERAQKIRSVGVQLQSAIGSITVAQHSTGPSANRELFGALFQQYKTGSDTLTSKIQLFLQRYRTNDAKGYDPWGGVTQATSYTSDLSQLTPCTTPDLSEVPAPADLRLVIPATFLIAEHLNLGKISICYEFGFANASRVVAHPDGTTFTYSHYQMTIKARFDDQPIWTRRTQTQREFLIDSLVSGQHHPIRYTMPQAIDFYWLQRDTFQQQFRTHENLPEIFLSQATEVTTDAERAAGLQTISSKLATLLRHHQRVVYSQMVGEFAEAGNLHTLGKQLSGAKAIWESFITIGLARTLEASDLLRSLIYGDAGVLDETDVQSAFGTALSLGLTAPDADIATVNLAPDLTTRATALNEAVSKALSAIENTQVRESVRVIDGALNRLDILIAQKQAGIQSH